MKPQDTVAFWLSYTLRSLTAALTELMRAHCEALGKPYVLTPQQFGIMKLLFADSEPPIQTISALSKQFVVEPPAITGIVTRLEQNGLVERIHDREDRRLVKVSLTAEGEDIIRALEPIVLAFQERLLPHGQQQALIAQLQALVARLGIPEHALNDAAAKVSDPVREHPND